MGWKDRVEFSHILGKTITKIEGGVGHDFIKFYTTDGDYEMFHSQDCCENVYVEDVTGDLEDLIGNPILLAEESTSNENPEGIKLDYQNSFTWTFYKLATIKGYVDIRWYGESNGYYSESVDFAFYPKKEIDNEKV